jgi:hypothetical protein
LLDRCEAKQKFILCEIIIRSNSSPRLAALIPQQEVLDEEVKSIQRCPPGFHLVYLPYADDFRQIERKIEAECNYYYHFIGTHRTIYLNRTMNRFDLIFLCF